MNLPGQTTPTTIVNTKDCDFIGDCIVITSINDDTVNFIDLTNSGALTMIGTGIRTRTEGAGAYIHIDNSGAIRNKASSDDGISAESSGGKTPGEEAGDIVISNSGAITVNDTGASGISVRTSGGTGDGEGGASGSVTVTNRGDLDIGFSGGFGIIVRSKGGDGSGGLNGPGGDTGAIEIDNSGDMDVESSVGIAIEAIAGSGGGSTGAITLRNRGAVTLGGFAGNGIELKVIAGTGATGGAIGAILIDNSGAITNSAQGRGGIQVTTTGGFASADRQGGNAGAGAIGTITIVNSGDIAVANGAANGILVGARAGVATGGDGGAGDRGGDAMGGATGAISIANSGDISTTGASFEPFQSAAILVTAGEGDATGGNGAAGGGAGSARAGDVGAITIGNSATLSATGPGIYVKAAGGRALLGAGGDGEESGGAGGTATGGSIAAIAITNDGMIGVRGADIGTGILIDAGAGLAGLTPSGAAAKAGNGLNGPGGAGGEGTGGSLGMISVTNSVDARIDTSSQHARGIAVTAASGAGAGSSGGDSLAGDGGRGGAGRSGAFAGVVVSNAGVIAGTGADVIGIYVDAGLAGARGGAGGTSGLGAGGAGGSATARDHGLIAVGNSGSIAISGDTIAAINVLARGTGHPGIRGVAQGGDGGRSESGNGGKGGDATGGSVGRIAVDNSNDISVNSGNGAAVAVALTGQEVNGGNGGDGATGGGGGAAQGASGDSVTVTNSGSMTTAGGYGITVTAEGGKATGGAGGIATRAGGGRGLGGMGAGGDVKVDVENSGDIIVAGFTAINLSAVGGGGTGGAGGTGGDGTGGDAAVLLRNSGRIVSEKGNAITAYAGGGLGVGGAGDVAGKGIGGSSEVAIANSGLIEAGLDGINAVASAGFAQGADGGTMGSGAVIVENSGRVTAGGNAIAARASGDNVAISITNAGMLEGVSAGILAETTSLIGTSIAIANSGFVAATGPSSFAIDSNGAATSLRNTGTILGRIDLTGEDDRFDNQAGGLFAARAISDFGAGDDLFDNAGTLRGAGDENAAETAELAGLETFRNSGLVSLVDGQAGDTLRMSGGPDMRYTGQDGKLAVDAFLAATAKGGKADMLFVTGATGGTTTVVVNVVNPQSATPNFDGIAVVSVEGVTHAQDFILDGGVLDAGFYAWGLQLDGTVHELVTIGPGAGSREFAAGVTATQDLWLQSGGVLQQRQMDLRSLIGGTTVTPVADFGELVTPIPVAKVTPGFWLSGLGAYVRRDEDRQTIWGGLAGFDFGTQDGGAALLFGVFGGYMTSELKFDETNTEWNYEGPTVGVYATYLDRAFFVDVTVKADFLDIEIDPEDLAPDADDGDTDALNIGGRIDTGYKFGEGMFVEPQASLAVVHSEIDDVDVFGGTVEFDDETSVRGRLGLRVGFDHQASDATIFTGDVIASVWEDFSGDNNATIADPALPSFGVSDDPGSTMGDVSIGFGVTAPEGWSGFLRGNYQFANDYDAYSGNAGLRYSW